MAQNNLGTFSLAQNQPAWIPSPGTAAKGGGGGLGGALGSIASLAGAANPMSFLASAAPGLVQGAFGLIGGLMAPSQKKKWKWEREHLGKLTDQRLSSINKSMKPDTPYFNMAKNAPQMTGMLNNLLGAKAGMYYGGAAGAPQWSNAMSGPIQGLSAPQSPANPTPGRVPPWAKGI